MSAVKSKIIRNAARDKTCHFNIVGYCNYDSSTSVMAHMPTDDFLSGYKSTDLASLAVCCSSCHDVIDGRVKHQVSESDLNFYMRRAQTRTLNMLFEMNIISIKGQK